MAKLIITGGFHHSNPLTLRVTKTEIVEVVDAERRGNLLSALFATLTRGQYDRMTRHFCGVKGCECGGIFNLRLMD